MKKNLPENALKTGLKYKRYGNAADFSFFEREKYVFYGVQIFF